MQIYLPIADLPVNIFLVLGMGLAVGFISGMFGIGGGFLMTPLLIFIGISPAVAVASVSSHIAASSFTGAITYWRKSALDVALAMMLLSAGIVGTATGVWLFTKLRELDQLDLMIGLSYVTLLTVVGALMIYESVRAEMRARQGMPATLRRPGSHTWLHGLPFKLRFKRSKIYVSAIPVWAIGFIIGFVGAIMGIGGGFLLVPMLIYFLRVPTATVIGTSMVLTLVTMASATVMHAATNHLVDAVLALILMVGGVIGAQFGARTGQKMRGERLRLLLGLLVFAVGLRFAYRAGGAAGRSVLAAPRGERMMRRLALTIPIVLMACGLRPAAAERLVVSLSNHRVAVTSSFVGEDLVLFGTVEPDAGKTALRSAYDLVVTVTGPRETLRTRRKQRVLGIWVNVDSREFVRVPSYLAVLSNRPVGDIADQDYFAAIAGRARQFSAAAAHRPRHRRYRARRSVPRRVRAAGASARPLPGIRQRGDLPDADRVPRRDPAAGQCADRQLCDRRQAVRRRRAGRAHQFGAGSDQDRLRAICRRRRARPRPALWLGDHADGAAHRLVRQRGVPARMIF